LLLQAAWDRKEYGGIWRFVCGIHQKLVAHIVDNAVTVIANFGNDGTEASLVVMYRARNRISFFTLARF